MARVSVNRDVLLWALQRSRKSRSELEKQFPKLDEWLAGKRLPTLGQLEDLASATATPLGYFFLDTLPEEPMPIPYYRTVRDELTDEPSVDLLDTIHTMQRRQAWMREYLQEEGHDKLPFVGSAPLSEPVASVANRMRRVLRLRDEWAAEYPSWSEALRALRGAMEDAGILVVINGVVGNNTHRRLDPTEFRGFVLVDEYAPLVFVNGADSKAAQMFTLAHELAHIFYGRSAAFDLRQMLPAKDDIEQACDRAAAEFLVPEDSLRRFWRALPRETTPFQGIARQFKVSELVAARRALDLGLIDKSEFIGFYHDYQARVRSDGTRDQGGNFYSNQDARVGRRFFRAVFEAVQEGRLLFSEAYDLTQLYGKTFDRYAASLGLGSAY